MGSAMAGMLLGVACVFVPVFGIWLVGRWIERRREDQ